MVFLTTTSTIYNNDKILTGHLFKTYIWKVDYRNKYYDVYLPNKEYEKLENYLYENRNREVEFIFIDEFSHPELIDPMYGMGDKQYAKLIYNESKID